MAPKSVPLGQLAKPASTPIAQAAKPASAPISQAAVPAVPAAPAAPAAAVVPPGPAKGVPKKETARIAVGAAQQKPVMPKATVKMQQTQPLAPMAPAVTTRPAVATAETEVTTAGTDTLTTVFSLLSAGVAIGAAVLCFLAYQAISTIQ
jgi:hypothetical protein